MRYMTLQTGQTSCSLSETWPLSSSLCLTESSQCLTITQHTEGLIDVSSWVSFSNMSITSFIRANGPIETVWSVLKRRCLSKFTKIMLRKKFSREACISTVEKEISHMEKQTFVNLCRVHYNDIGELIQKIKTDYIYPLPPDKFDYENWFHLAVQKA